MSEPDVCRRQVLTSKVGPRAERDKIDDPMGRYSRDKTLTMYHIYNYATHLFIKVIIQHSYEVSREDLNHMYCFI